MLWQFDPREMKSTELRDAEPGDVVCPLHSTAPPVLWLVLAGDENTQNILRLSGPNVLKVWEVPSQRSLPTVVIAKRASLQVQVAGDRGIVQMQGRPGELVFTGDAAYCGALIDRQGFPDKCYISLADWSINALHQVTPANASVSAWRLVHVRSPEEREVLFAYGDW